MTKDVQIASTNFNLPAELSPILIFEDPHLVVLSKPAGLLSQGEHTGDNNLVDALRVYFKRHYVGLVHRLDRNTSGIMVVAKRTKSANRLTSSLQKGTLVRTYLGWVLGHLNEPTHWHHLLEKDSNQNTVKVLRKGGKESSLYATPQTRIQWKGHPLTLVEFKLETGRSHQIRVQSAHEGHPLLGDRKYGSNQTPDFPRVALHSYRIQFPHPMSGEILSFESPLPDDLKIQPFR